MDGEAVLYSIVVALFLVLLISVCVIQWGHKSMRRRADSELRRQRMVQSALTEEAKEQARREGLKDLAPKKDKPSSL
jgi:cell division protein FtsL